ncbi:Organ-specific protein P4 [Bienertia sinuspersici]
MKDQPIPEAFKGMMEYRPSENNMEEEVEVFTKYFDPMPNISAYHDDVTEKEMKAPKEDCNSHRDGLKSKKLVGDDFKPRPTISIYND